MRILITGGAGFIGSNMVRYWLEKHPEDILIVIDSLTYAGNIASLRDIRTHRLKFFKGSIANMEFIEHIFHSEEVDAVIHFAAESHVDNSISGPSKFIETNVMGTFVLLEIAKKVWRKKDYLSNLFLHVSTDEVYGSLGEDDKFLEESPYRPNSPYSATKAASDHLVRSYANTYNVPSIITHCSNNYGPYQHPEKLIPRVIINGLHGTTIPVYGNGKNVRDWIYVLDHCKALEAIFINGRKGNVYNIGGDCEMPNIDIVTMICKKMDEFLGRDQGMSTLNQIMYVEDRPGHDFRYAIDNTKIVRELNWLPAMDFETGISETIRWYLENKWWWERFELAKSE